MAVTATPIPLPGSAEPVQALGDLWTAFASLAFSGNYATGGDSWDASTLFTGQANPTSILVVDVAGGAGYSAEYDKVAKKLKIFSASGTELAAGAYPAALTGDANVVAQVVAK